MKQVVPLEQRYRTLPPLSREEEYQLFESYRAGDESAGEKIILANLRFTILFARRYTGGPLSLEELISEGIVGMFEALKRFDHTRGLKFISYQVHWIKQTILQALGQGDSVVRTSYTTINDRQGIERATTRLLQELGREPSLEEIAFQADLSEERTRRSIEASRRDQSLDAPIKSEEKAKSLLEIFQADTFPDAGQILEKEERRLLVERLLDELNNPRDRCVMVRYFGLDGIPPRTLEEIGQQIGVSRERVRQLKEAALEKLQRAVTRHAKEEEPVDEGAIA